MNPTEDQIEQVADALSDWNVGECTTAEVATRMQAIFAPRMEWDPKNPNVLLWAGLPVVKVGPFGAGSAWAVWRGHSVIGEIVATRDAAVAAAEAHIRNLIGESK